MTNPAFEGLSSYTTARDTTFAHVAAIPTIAHLAQMGVQVLG